MNRRFLQILSYSLVVALTVACYFSVFPPSGGANATADTQNIMPADKLQELVDYCKAHNLYYRRVIIVDFAIRSSQPRFFVVNTQNRAIELQSKCASGSGSDNSYPPKFSNEPGSNCSSIGHFAVVVKRRMNTRRLNSFVLNGLDSTNSNAHQRGILIHPSHTVDAYADSANALIPASSQVSSGCFAIESAAMSKLEAIFAKADRPMLLYAFF